ncbi:MAG: peptidase [Rhodobacteraceae bacterium]|nr:MAG: peptidase [Paracoccaceae bacterium]
MRHDRRSASRPPRRLFRSLAAALAFLAAGCAGGPPTEAPRTVAQRPAAEQRAGDRSHEQLVAQFGGAYRGPVAAYVNELGRRLAAVSEQPQGPWTFTVLDNPTVNAFALPGGYVYVTRGLIALANDEAELAGVIGHEIGHVTAGHGAQRQTRSTIAQIGVLAAVIGAAAAGLDGPALDAVGQMGSAVGAGVIASYSRAQEFEADLLGVRYLSRAGLDPFAQADFLESMKAQTALSTRLAGGAYDPTRVDFFASHPATADRAREAVRAARLEAGARPGEGARNRDRFLSAIDGMTFGDSRAHGFVRGRRFVHPELRFAFSAPEGFTIMNASTQVAARGPRDAALVFDGGTDPGGPLDAYVARVWAAGISRQARTGPLQGLERTRIGGMEAATAFLPIDTGRGVRIAQLTAIRTGDGRVYRFLGLSNRDDAAMRAALDRAARGFERLSAAEAARLQPWRIRVVTVRPGETAESLAARTPFDRARVERFRVMNGLAPGAQPRPGDRVKLVVE